MAEPPTPPHRPPPPARPDRGRYGPWLEAPRRRVHAALDRLHPWLAEFLIFGFKQGWACLFGGVMVGLIIATRLVWRPDWPLHRYDALFLAALAVQALLLALRLETWREAKVIALFHLVGTVMEIFKTAQGSWTYPEAAFFRIGHVPLFSGFMYACVGSYIARATRILDLRYSHHPPLWATALLAGGIYVNFFTHHYMADLRLALFAATALMFRRTRVHFTVDRAVRWMPLLLGFFLVTFFIWIAENVGTLTGSWLYPHQAAGSWRMVTLGKLGSWYLLMIISFVLVSLVHPPRPPEPAAALAEAEAEAELAPARYGPVPLGAEARERE